MNTYSNWLIIDTNLKGVKKIVPSHDLKITEDLILKFSNVQFMLKNDLNIDFVQDDVSFSKKNVLRGIHGDQNTTKLVTCLLGSFQLIVVNNDPNSNQFRQWESFDMSFENRLQILIPPKFGNGHLVLRICYISLQKYSI